MRQRHSRTSSALLLLPFLASACSKGGEEDRPTSTVKVESTAYIFGMTGKPEFGPFPVTVGDVLTFDDRLFLLPDGTYRRTDADGVDVATDVYELEPDGTFSILVPVGTNAVRYRGGLGLEERSDGLKARDGFLTDRIGTAVGLYIATEILPGEAPADPTDFDVRYGGNWHVFSLHANFVSATTAPDEDRVGLAFAGSMDVEPDGSFLGQGVESEEGSIRIRGEPADFDVARDGRISLELRYDTSNKPDYERRFLGGGGSRALFGVDPNLGGDDVAAGLVAAMRFRTADFANADLAGTYSLGLWTLFINPAASGSDAAIGTLTLTRDRDFVLRATNNAGQEFEYRGTFQAEQSGALTFSVTAPYTETWYGAFDDAYATVVLCDSFKESRGNSVKELSLGIAVRPRMPPP